MVSRMNTLQGDLASITQTKEEHKSMAEDLEKRTQERDSVKLENDKLKMFLQRKLAEHKQTLIKHEAEIKEA